jgi:thiol-disulfide isomerase/thioredoxin
MMLACVAILGGCQRAPAPVETPTSTTATTARAATADSPAQIATTRDQPALVIDTIDGKRFDLAQHRGRWVVVNFWATWCAPCLKEMPALSALDTMREHIDVVGLAYEDTTPEEMRAFLQKHPVSYPVALIAVYAPPADFETPRKIFPPPTTTATSTPNAWTAFISRATDSATAISMP